MSHKYCAKCYYGDFTRFRKCVGCECYERKHEGQRVKPFLTIVMRHASPPTVCCDDNGSVLSSGGRYQPFCLDPSPVRQELRLPTAVTPHVSSDPRVRTDAQQSCSRCYIKPDPMGHQCTPSNGIMREVWHREQRRLRGQFFILGRLLGSRERDRAHGGPTGNSTDNWPYKSN